MSRRERLSDRDRVCLRVFGLYVQGEWTYSQLAYITSMSPASVRQAVWRGWCLVRDLCPTRWPSHRWPHTRLIDLKGNRRPRPAPTPPVTATPSQRFLVKLEALEQEARRDGLQVEADSLRNMRVALQYWAKDRSTKKAG